MTRYFYLTDEQKEEQRREAWVARDEAISRVSNNASPIWKAEALEAIKRLAQTRVPFTADEVWEVLERRGVVMPRTPAALGPVFLAAARNGYIMKTGQLVMTRYARRHRDLTEWIGT